VSSRGYFFEVRRRTPAPVRPRAALADRPDARPDAIFFAGEVVVARAGDFSVDFAVFDARRPEEGTIAS